MTAQRKKAEIHEFTLRFMQDADSCDANGPSQFLDVKQEDGGGGPFWLIETERWAFESIAELVDVLKRAGVPEVSPYSEIADKPELVAP